MGKTNLFPIVAGSTEKGDKMKVGELSLLKLYPSYDNY